MTSSSAPASWCDVRTLRSCLLSDRISTSVTSTIEKVAMNAAKPGPPENSVNLSLLFQYYPAS